MFLVHSRVDSCHVTTILEKELWGHYKHFYKGSGHKVLCILSLGATLPAVQKPSEAKPPPKTNNDEAKAHVDHDDPEDEAINASPTSSPTKVGKGR